MGIKLINSFYLLFVNISCLVYVKSNFNYKIIPLHNSSFLSYLSTENLKLAKDIEKLFPESNPKQMLEIDSIPFINSKSCLTVLDFYREATISKLTKPVIIRKPVPAIMIITTNHEYIRPIWVPINQEIFIASGAQLECQKTSLFSGILSLVRETDYCLFLDFFKFVSKSKPWTCQIHVSLFQPVANLKPEKGGFCLTHPRVFEYVGIFSGFKHRVPSIMPGNIIKVHNGALEDSDKLFLYEWSQSKGNCDPGAQNRDLWVSNDLWFFINLKTNPIFKSLLLPKHIYSVKSTFLFRVCPSCSKRLVSLEISKNEINEILSTNRTLLNKLTLCENNLWEIKGSRNEMASVKFYQSLLQCSLAKFSRNGPFFKNSKVSPADQIEISHAVLWTSIWKNYTYVSGRGNICSSGISKSVSIQYTKSLQHGLQITYKKYSGLVYSQSPLSLEDNIESLKFVSCISDDNSVLLFGMLYNIYDKYIWLSILICLIAILTIVFIKTGQILYALNVTEGMIGLAIEQGSLILDKVSKFSSLRICLSAFYLTFIVLSNAYKSQNVYYIVSPRQQVPYETFEQLINDKFTIYSRGFRPKFTAMKNTDQNDSFQIISKLDTKHSLRLMIPSFGRATVYSDAYGLKLAYYSKISLPLAESKIIGNTSLHPDVIQITKKLGQILFKHFNNSKAKEVNGTFYGNKFRELYFEKERNALFAHLSLCKKAALVLPAFEGIAFARKLKGKKLSVDVGKETFFKLYHTFKLKGNIAPVIIQRIQSVRQSGLFEWWSMILGRSTLMRNGRSENKLVRPTMDGNILVIFVVLFVGLLAAVIVLSIEVVCAGIKNIEICVRSYYRNNCYRTHFVYYP